jgi:hypothetical protein
MAQPCCKHLSGSLDLLLGLGTFTEAVLETTRNVLEVAHTAGTGGLSTLGLDRPVDCIQLGYSLIFLSSIRHKFTCHLQERILAAG